MYSSTQQKVTDQLEKKSRNVRKLTMTLLVTSADTSPKQGNKSKYDYPVNENKQGHDTEYISQVRGMWDQSFCVP